MKLVVGTTSYPRPEMSYAGSFVAQWRAALEHAGVSSLVLRPRGTQGKQADVEYKTWGKLLLSAGAPDLLAQSPITQGFNGLLQSLSIARVVAQHAHKGDLFVGHWLLPWGLCLPKRTPSHLYAHGSDIALLEQLPRQLANPMIRRIDSTAQGISFVSSHLKERYLKLLGQAPHANLSITPMGVEESPRNEAFYQDLMTFKGKRKLVAALGRHVPIKGLDLLIRSAHQLPDLCLVIAGDGPETPALKTLSQRLEIPVRFTGAFTPNARTALLDAADVVVQPSRHLGTRQEGSPVTVREAINHGTPCILSDTQGHLDFEGSGVIRFFPQGNVDGLAHILRTELDELITDGSKARALEHQGRFTWSRQIEAHLMCLNTSLNRAA
ncbi:MAG: glycosyltransferase family 4 protein [Bradymonadia bacterium]